MRTFAFLLSSIFLVNFVMATVECRLEEDGEIVYGDLSESMCAHLGGLNMNALGFPVNRNYSGSMNESRFLFTNLMIDKALGRDSYTERQNQMKAIVKCKLVDGDEVIIGHLSRFMCDHLAGEEVVDNKQKSAKITDKVKKSIRKQAVMRKGKQVDIECRIEDDGELFYADMTRFMCSHLGGVVLDDLNLSKNPQYNGSIHSSRFLDEHPKAIVKCHIQEGDEEITGDLSRFMCDHLGGTIITDTPEQPVTPYSLGSDDLEASFNDLSGATVENTKQESFKKLIKKKVPALKFYNSSTTTEDSEDYREFDPHKEVLLLLRDNGKRTLDSHLKSDRKTCWFIHDFDQLEISYLSLDKMSKKHMQDGSGFRDYFYELRDYIEDKTGQPAAEYIRQEKRKVKKIAKKLGCKR